MPLAVALLASLLVCPALSFLGYGIGRVDDSAPFSTLATVRVFAGPNDTDAVVSVLPYSSCSAASMGHQGSLALLCTDSNSMGHLVLFDLASRGHSSLLTAGMDARFGVLSAFGNAVFFSHQSKGENVSTLLRYEINSRSVSTIASLRQCNVLSIAAVSETRAAVLCYRDMSIRLVGSDGSQPQLVQPPRGCGTPFQVVAHSGGIMLLDDSGHLFAGKTFDALNARVDLDQDALYSDLDFSTSEGSAFLITFAAEDDSFGVSALSLSTGALSFTPLKDPLFVLTTGK